MSALHKLMYQRILFCHKCHRSMFVGLNRRYLCHLLKHTAINKLLILLAVLGLISLYPSTISIMSAKKIGLASYVSEAEFKQERIVQAIRGRPLMLLYPQLETSRIRGRAGWIWKQAQNSHSIPFRRRLPCHMEQMKIHLFDREQRNQND